MGKVVDPKGRKVGQSSHQGAEKNQKGHKG